MTEVDQKRAAKIKRGIARLASIPTVDNPRSAMLTARVTPDQAAEVKAIAADLGIPVSEYLRNVILAAHPRTAKLADGADQ